MRAFRSLWHVTFTVLIFRVKFIFSDVRYWSWVHERKSNNVLTHKAMKLNKCALEHKIHPICVWQYRGVFWAIKNNWFAEWMFRRVWSRIFHIKSTFNWWTFSGFITISVGYGPSETTRIDTWKYESCYFFVLQSWSEIFLPRQHQICCKLNHKI